MTDFTLPGLHEGSIVPELDAPEIQNISQNKQFGLFDEPETDELLHESAFGLLTYLYDRAGEHEKGSNLLDKHLLRRMRDFEKLLKSEEAEILFETEGICKVSSFRLNKTSLNKISIVEQETPESLKTSVVGELDTMRHKKQQMELITGDGKRIRAVPGADQNIRSLKEYFGQRVKITGLAHFKSDKSIKSLEILDIRKAEPNEEHHEELTQPIFEDIDLKYLASEQGWSGFDEKKFRKTIKELDVQESPEELLRLLDS